MTNSDVGDVRAALRKMGWKRICSWRDYELWFPKDVEELPSKIIILDIDGLNIYWYSKA